jgi:PAS domain S-box-containing protein
MRKILIIDDSKENLILLSNTLKDLISNCEITTCNDSRTAIEIAVKIKPDVILTDVLMPHLDGIELCELFRADETLKNIPIIILSGSNVDIEGRINCLKAGADVFLSKPIETTELVAQINAMLRLKIAEDDLKRKNINLKTELSVSEEKFINIADDSPNMIFINHQGKIKYANKACENITGYTIEEFYADEFDFKILIHPDDLEKIVIDFQNNLKGIEAPASEFKTIAKSGEKITVILNSKLISFEGEKAILGIMTDITERKAIEQELEYSEEKYRTIFEATGTATMLVKDDNKILQVNQQCVNLSGFSTAELVDYNWMKFAYVEDLPLMQRLFKIKNSKPGLIPDKIETRLIDKSGNIRNVIMTIKKIQNSNLNVVSMLDITDRKVAEKQVMASEIRFKKIFETSPISIWEEDFSGAYNYIQSLKKKGVTDFNEYFEQNFDEVILCAQKVKVLDVNDTTVTMFQAKSKSELIRDLNKIFTDKSLLLFKNQLVKIANQELYYNGTSENVTFGGKILDILLRWNVMPGFKNDYSHVLVTLIDITENEKYKRKIQNLLEEKEIILHEVHHRIKNNMASIESLFKIQVRTTEDEKVKKILMDAVSRLHGMRVLYDKLYRADNFQETAVKDYFSDLVSEIISLFPNGDKVTTETDIDNFMIPANLNFPICIIINELISNSMKYAFNDNSKKNLIKLTAKLKNKKVVIVVQDNGAGLPADFDVDNSEGFGMKLVKMLTDQINGNISFESKNGTKWILEFDTQES